MSNRDDVEKAIKERIARVEEIYAKDPVLKAAADRVSAWGGTKTSDNIMAVSKLATLVTGIDTFSFIIGKTFQSAAARSPFASEGQTEKILAIFRALRDALPTAAIRVNDDHPGGPEALESARKESQLLQDMLDLSIAEYQSADFQAEVQAEVQAHELMARAPAGHC